MNRGIVVVLATCSAWGCASSQGNVESRSSDPSPPYPPEPPLAWPAPQAKASDPVDADVSSVLPPPPCPEDMVDVVVSCIDRYEAPNEKGARPMMMQTAHDAEAWCVARGKRLCSETEWVRACEGPEGLPFPYGAEFRPGVCNDDKTWKPVNWGRLSRWPDAVAKAEAEKLDQSEASGAREGCQSAEGVFDLTGNAAEWVIRTRDNPTNYSHVVKGCYWGKCYRPPHTPTCEYVNYGHQAGFRSYEFGFRCCKDRLGH